MRSRNWRFQVQPSDEARDRLAMCQVHDSVWEVPVFVHLHEKHLRSLQIEEGPEVQLVHLVVVQTRR